MISLNTNYTSPNYNERPLEKPINMVIVHYTDMLSAEEALQRLCDPASKVSAHYLIDKQGQIFQLVDEAHRAWHAGVSSWEGETDINNGSIGIELDNGGHTHGPEPFPDEQIRSLLVLLKDLVDRHKIQPHRILGHSDIAPGRKIDPGPLFPWDILAKHGFGLAAKT